MSGCHPMSPAGPGPQPQPQPGAGGGGAAAGAGGGEAAGADAAPRALRHLENPRPCLEQEQVGVHPPLHHRGFGFGGPYHHSLDLFITGQSTPTARGCPPTPPCSRTGGCPPQCSRYSTREGTGCLSFHNSLSTLTLLPYSHRPPAGGTTPTKGECPHRPFVWLGGRTRSPPGAHVPPAIPRPPLPAQEMVRALYEFQARNPQELSVRMGDTLQVQTGGSPHGWRPGRG